MNTEQYFNYFEDFCNRVTTTNFLKYRSYELFGIISGDNFTPLRFYFSQDLASEYRMTLDYEGYLIKIPVLRPHYEAGKLKNPDGKFLFRSNAYTVKEYLDFDDIETRISEKIKSPKHIFFENDYLIDERSYNSGFDYFWNKYNGNDIFVGILDVDKNDNYYYRFTTREIDQEAANKKLDPQLMNFLSGLDPYC